MQGIFTISRIWHDPVPSLKRSAALILAVLSIESLAFLLKDCRPLFSPIYIMGTLRLADVLVLWTWGPWSFDRTLRTQRVKDSVVITAFVVSAGIAFIFIWKGVLGWPSPILGAKASLSGGSKVIAFYATSCLISPIAEELFFRGFFYRVMREKWNAWVCMGIVSVLFASVHYYFNGQALVPFLGSLIFCLGYENTKSILTPALLHMTGNLIIYFFPLFRAV